MDFFERLAKVNLLNVAPSLGTSVAHLRLWKSRVISKHKTHKCRGWMERRETIIYNSKDRLSVNDGGSLDGWGPKDDRKVSRSCQNQWSGGWPDEESPSGRMLRIGVWNSRKRTLRWTQGSECFLWLWSLESRSQENNRLSSDFDLWRLVVNRRTGCSLTSVSDAPNGDSAAILDTIYQRQFRTC